jgi:NADPH2:quinone reductase
MQAIQVQEFGGPEVLELREVADPAPADGLELIDVTAAGINYADTHQTENSYLAPTQLPLIPGAEVVGTIGGERRVVALLPAGGGYAERALAPPQTTVDVPDGVGDGEALAMVLQGLTAWHLLRTSARLQEGESVVVHAAAGGVGTLAVQLARRWGAGRVIAAASSPEKRDLALQLGADVAIDARAEDLNAAIREAADGKADVILEMVGGRTFDDSLRALAPLGRLVTFGMAGRELPTPVAPGSLVQGSKAVVGFWAAHCFSRPGLFREPVQELMELVAAGELRAVVGGTYPLAQARQAHEDMLARRTVGKLVLDPRS